MPRMVHTALIALALSGPVIAAEANDPVPAGVESLTRGLVQGEDVELVLRYLRDALGAAVEGRAAPVPDALTQRAEAIAEEVRRRGITAGRAALDAIELAVRERLREPSAPRLPPSSPLQRI